MATRLARIISKKRRHCFIERFHLLKLWYGKGVGILGSVMVFQLSDIAILVAVAKYLFGDHVSLWWISAAAVVFYVIRTALYLLLGWMWEREGGWWIAAKLNGDRVEPGRTVIVNTDDLALLVAKYVRMDGVNLKAIIE